MTYTARANHKRGQSNSPAQITGPQDIDALILELSTDDGDNTIAGIYINERPATAQGLPDHELRIAIDGERKVGAIRYMSGDDAWYAVGQKSNLDEVLYFYMGHDEQYPQDSEITLDEIRTATNEFLASGGERPMSPTWSEWPPHL
ncbi:MAG TPA: Imm1 family immunity protein [Kribbella sp.]|uniref:Imm1 family immunity protein n=1 Tax=Kribbella sp. TaxID=1871183 RepID=UPI002D79753A|nr:Imm1 family immunity protein [Kribbella sp.]HET6294187.1 Imm1 family immunity protein [Kribbella sp.]